MADISLHGAYALLRDPAGLAIRRCPDHLTLCLPWGALTEAFLEAFNALQRFNPELSAAAVLELMWPSLVADATRDN